MPRIAGVSCSSVTRPILLSLRPISVARCEWWGRVSLPVCSTLIIFAALAIVITPKSASERACCLFCHHFGVAADAARLQRGHLDVTACRHPTRGIPMLPRVESGANPVVGIRRADRLRHHVLDTERLEHRAHRATGDDAGTGGGGAAGKAGPPPAGR